MRPLLVMAASLVISTMSVGLANADGHGNIRFWTTENQPDRLAKQQAMADAFKKALALLLRSLLAIFPMLSIIRCSMSCHGPKLEF